MQEPRLTAPPLKMLCTDRKFQVGLATKYKAIAAESNNDYLGRLFVVVSVMISRLLRRLAVCWFCCLRDLRAIRTSTFGVNVCCDFFLLRLSQNTANRSLSVWCAHCTV